MAINWWVLEGRKTSFNPLPGAVSDTVTGVMPYCDYRLILKAKSPTSATIRASAGASIYAEIALTPELKEYVVNFTTSDKNFIYIYDKNAANNIEVQDIQLVEKPTGKTTINGVDGFGSVKPGFTGKLSATGDFVGKVVGDISANPHVAWRTGTNPAITSLLRPDSAKLAGWGWYSEFVPDVLGGPLGGQSSNIINGGISQHLITFDVIALLEKQITVNAIPYTDKMAWLKNNINKISVDWHGNGSGPAGNKAYLKLWYYASDNWGATTDSHTSGAIAKLNRTISSNFEDTIGPGGFVHALAYADAGNGTIPSVISTDYVSITVEMKQDAVVNSKWTLHPNAKLINNETLELNTTASFQKSTLEVPVEPGQELTMSIGENLITGARLAGEWLNASNGSLGFTAEVKVNESSKTFTAPTNASKLRVSVDNTGAAPVGSFIFKKPMVNIGGPVPYEPKRGERMVLPVIAGKNLFSVLHLTNFNWTVQAMYKEYILKPNTEYTLSSNVPVTALANIYLNGSNTTTDGVFVNRPITKKTGADGKIFVAIPNNPYREYTTGLLDGTYYIQLEEGSTATPPEKFRVQRAKKANGVPKKNLLDPKAWVKGRIYDTGFMPAGVRIEGNNVVIVHNNAAFVAQVVAVEPNTDYSAWHKSNANHGIYIYTKAGGALNPVVRTSPVTFNTGNNTEIIFALYKAGAMDGTMEANFIEPQLEKGAKETPFEPYKLQARRARKEPKNILPTNPSEWEVGHINSAGADTGTAANMRTKNKMPIKGGATYVYSETVIGSNKRIIVYYYDAAGAFISTPNAFWAAGQVFTTPSNAAFYRCSAKNADDVPLLPETMGVSTKIKIEEGTTPTPYEPYKLIGRPARKGLEMDGKTDYLQAESTVREPNYPFAIETAFTWNGNHYGGTIGLFGNAGFGLRFDGLGAPLNKINFVKYDVADQRITIPYDIVPGKRYVVKLIVETTKITLYINGVYVGEFLNSAPYNSGYYNNGKAGFPASAKFVIGAQGLTVPQHFFHGVMEYVKYFDNVGPILEYNFMKPALNLGTKYKAIAGPSGEIKGNPIQLNRQARR
jgi:hypothetical protein